MPTIGLIGLGNMGAPMAANLLTAGHQVVGYDVVASAGAAWSQKGGRAASRAGSRGRRRNRHHDAAGRLQVRQVYLGPDGVIARARRGRC
jgi:3-hydroxyisobutyrate dehydrogenase